MNGFRTWSVALLLGSIALVPRAQAGDWKPLFNGKDLTGWKAIDGPQETWKAEDGMLVCTGGGGAWLSTTDEYANYELELEFRVPPGGNSGVFLRSPHKGNPAYAGMEIQILDDEDEQYANLQPFQYCGSIYGIQAPKSRVSKKAGQWQKVHIVCDGRKVKVTLNDTPIVDANLDQYKDKEAEHPGITRTIGYVGLQNHGSRLEFKNLRIRTLP
jgi:hypothetical protein